MTQAEVLLSPEMRQQNRDTWSASHFARGAQAVDADLFGASAAAAAAMLADLRTRPASWEPLQVIILTTLRCRSGRRLVPRGSGQLHEAASSMTQLPT